MVPALNAISGPMYGTVQKTSLIWSMISFQYSQYRSPPAWSELCSTPPHADIICGICASFERNQGAEMISDVKQKSKQVPSLFPGNNGEHLQFDEESITSTILWFRTTANKCESRWAGQVKGRPRRTQTNPVFKKCPVIVCVAATLTSYSENMERGSKYGEGSRGNLKLWQPQKSGMDSFLYRVDENMTASTYSLNKIPERNLESMSSHSAHSIPLYLMPRPNSVAGESLPLSLPHLWK